jgi:hypothetical protein
MQNTGRISACLLEIRRPVGRKGHTLLASPGTARIRTRGLAEGPIPVHPEIAFQYRNSKS